MRVLPWISVAVMALAVALFGRYCLERHESAALQAEIALLEHENRQLAELRTEHARLLAAKVSDADLERLRSDRAALGRLRVEIGLLRDSAERRAVALRDPASGERPAVVLAVEIASDGGLLLNGAPVHFDALRQLFADFARRAERVDVRIRVMTTEPARGRAREALERFVRLGMELRVKMAVRFEHPPQ